MTAYALTAISRWICKSASPVSRPSLIHDFSNVFTILRVEKQSWGDKFVIWGEFMRPWNRKIGKTGYQKTLQRLPPRVLGGGERSPTLPPPPMDPPLFSSQHLFRQKSSYLQRILNRNQQLKKVSMQVKCIKIGCLFKNQCMLHFRLHFIPDMAKRELVTFAR